MMNIIRTKAVELSVIPAIAYKRKLASGGSGIKIFRIDADKCAACTIDKRSGECVPYGGVIDESLFPAEAFDEALELTVGLPYSARGKIRLSAAVEIPEAEDGITENAPEKTDVCDLDEYKALVERYSDEKGKINYQLMNKDFIQFAAKSKTVADMIRDKAGTDAVLLFAVKSRATFIAGKKESLSDETVKELIETLDEIDPRSAFKELKAYINRLSAKQARG